MTTAMSNASECVIFRQKCNIRSLPFSRFICAKGSLKTSIPLLHLKSVMLQNRRNCLHRLKLFKTKFRMIMDLL